MAIMSYLISFLSRLPTKFNPIFRAALVLMLLCVSETFAATTLQLELLTNSQVALKWSAAEREWVLEQVAGWSAPSSWSSVVGPLVTNGDQRQVTLPRSGAGRYFRLRAAGSTPTQTSEALIAEALQSGTISPETALIYRVYALFKDSRLPEIYRGDDSAAGESGALEEAVERWATLTDGTRTALTPFLTPPAYQGSWKNPLPAGAIQASAVDRPQLDPNWAAVPVIGGNVKVWYDSRVPGEHATRERAEQQDLARDYRPWDSPSAFRHEHSPVRRRGRSARRLSHRHGECGRGLDALRG